MKKALLLILFFFIGASADRLYLQFTRQLKNSSELSNNLKAEIEETLPEKNLKGDLTLVTRVIDGDTIEIQGGEKVRYIGIDAPESVSPREPAECFAKNALAKNKSLVEGKKVLLVKDTSERDRYGRLLRYVYVGNSFVNKILIEEGYASAVTFPPDVSYSKTFKALENEAKTQNKGLWKECESAIPVSAFEEADSKTACDIKGNINTNGEKIYHLPDCPYYSKTVIDEKRGERFFCSEEEAVKASWRRALTC